jgi:hypothetical protein
VTLPKNGEGRERSRPFLTNKHLNVQIKTRQTSIISTVCRTSLDFEQIAFFCVVKCTNPFEFPIFPKAIRSNLHSSLKKAGPRRPDAEKRQTYVRDPHRLPS